MRKNATVVDSKQSKIEEELEYQQKDAFRAIKIYMQNMHYYLQQCNIDKFSVDKFPLEGIGFLIKQFEEATDTAKSMVTRHFAQRVVANAYRKVKKGDND